jgi:hypothetical protein
MTVNVFGLAITFNGHIDSSSGLSPRRASRARVEWAPSIAPCRASKTLGWVGISEGKVYC